MQQKKSILKLANLKFATPALLISVLAVASCKGFWIDDTSNRNRIIQPLCEERSVARLVTVYSEYLNTGFYSSQTISIIFSEYKNNSITFIYQVFIDERFDDEDKVISANVYHDLSNGHVVPYETFHETKLHKPAIHHLLPFDFPFSGVDDPMEPIDIHIQSVTENEIAYELRPRGNLRLQADDYSCQ